MIRLIESSGDGTIKIWNFHIGILIKRINIIYNKRVLGLCLWSDNYIFVGCEDKTMKLVDIKNEEVVNNLIGNNDIVLNIKKIKHPKYGDCLISQGLKNNQIKLWIKKIKKKKKKSEKI
jgi:WD40 repeat protein